MNGRLLIDGELEFFNQDYQVHSGPKNGYGIVYQLKGDHLSGEMEVYSVYPGMELIFQQFFGQSFTLPHPPYKNRMQIHFCRSKRVGWQLDSGAYMYLGEGDFSLHLMDNCVSSVLNFPFGQYEGLMIILDLDRMEKQLPEILREALDMRAFQKKFCGGDSHLVIPANQELGHILGEMAKVPEAIKKAYFQLKIQELLLFLSMVDVTEEKERSHFLSPQVELIKEIHKKLTSNLQERPTILSLSKEYLINTATLKATFKGVYGQPIASYMKEYRIRRAATLLRETPDSISAIARQVGYQNQSKFAAAFQAIMKQSPSDYRAIYQDKV